MKLENTLRWIEAKAQPYHNLRAAAKAVLKGKFAAVKIYIIKEEWSQTNNLNFHFRKTRRRKANFAMFWETNPTCQGSESGL